MAAEVKEWLEIISNEAVLKQMRESQLNISGLRRSDDLPEDPEVKAEREDEMESMAQYKLKCESVCAVLTYLMDSEVDSDSVIFYHTPEAVRLMKKALGSTSVPSRIGALTGPW